MNDWMVISTACDIVLAIRLNQELGDLVACNFRLAVIIILISAVSCPFA